MNSRERVQRAINHQEPDRVPLDLGGSLVTGMNVSMVAVYETVRECGRYPLK